MQPLSLVILGFAAAAQAKCKKPVSHSQAPSGYPVHAYNTSSVGSSTAYTTSSLTSSTTSSSTTSSSTSSSTSSTTTTATTECIYNQCIDPTAVPEVDQASVSALCSSLVTLEPVIVSATVTASTTLFVTPEPVAVTSETTETTTTTTTVTVNSICQGPTVTVSASTYVLYPSRAAAPTAPARRAEGDEAAIEVSVDLDFFASKCNGQAPALSQLSSACSCILTAPTSTTTLTVTETASVTLPPVSSTAEVTVTETDTATETETTCTSTSTATITATNACGTDLPTPTASTTGFITCASSVAAPSQNARHRIEGNNVEGTIYEGCIVAGPRIVTTPSGGSHLCDGTQNNANPSPGTTITDQLDAAARLNGFPFDGTFSNQFQDFFINSIGASSQVGNQYWGVLNEGVFTPAGGCESQTVTGQTSLWAFDAFNANGFLKIEPDYAVAQAGQGSVTVRVLSVDPNSGSSAPYGGAQVVSQTSDASGMVTIQIPTTPGCYQYKATANGQIRSNAFYLNVVDHFST